MFLFSTFPFASRTRAQAMMVPDYGMAPSELVETWRIARIAHRFRHRFVDLSWRGLIGEISFYAFGFEKGRHLAKKMVLCSVL